MRFVVVGCGAWATKVHLPYLHAQPDVALVAVVDADISRASETAGRFGAPVATDDLESVLSVAVCDAVVISTPHAFHHEQARAALIAGVHVHVDKPLSRLPAQFDELARIARSNRLLLSTHAQKKYGPGHNTLRYYARTFAEIYHASGAIWQPLLPDYAGSWRADRDLATGGILMDSGYHVVDTLVSLLGGSETDLGDVAVSTHNAKQGSDAFASLLFQMSAVVVQASSFRGVPDALQKDEYVVIGDGGCVTVWETPRDGAHYRYVSHDGAVDETDSCATTIGHRIFPLELFVKALRGDDEARRAVNDDVATARVTVEILSRAYAGMGD
jgi:predicted dehydrogenase